MEIIETRPPVGWFEIHAENFMGDGGRPLEILQSIAEDYPLSVHGVGLSLGGASDLDGRHLTRLRRLVDAVEPGLVSEHLAWCTQGDDHFADLLPLPYTAEALEIVCRHVDETQNFLGRRILIENPSLYVAFEQEDMPEPAFLNALVQKTGCGLLLDVNNVCVSAVNLDRDADTYLREIDAASVGEIHLAGHHVRNLGDRTLLIDDHGSRVSDAVWSLFEMVLQRTGPVPTLIEWDNDVPQLSVLIDETRKAEAMLARTGQIGAEDVRAA